MQGKVDLCRGARDMVSGEQVLLTNRITPHIFTFLGWGGVKVLLRLSSNIFHKLLKVLTHILKDPPSKLARESCRHCIDATLVLSFRSLTSSRSTEVPLPALLLPLSKLLISSSYPHLSYHHTTTVVIILKEIFIIIIVTNIYSEQCLIFDVADIYLEFDECSQPSNPIQFVFILHRPSNSEKAKSFKQNNPWPRVTLDISIRKSCLKKELNLKNQHFVYTF